MEIDTADLTDYMKISLSTKSVIFISIRTQSDEEKKMEIGYTEIKFRSLTMGKIQIV